MTSDQIGGIVRAIVTAAVGYAAGKGLIGADQVAGIVTAVVTIAVAIWSWHTNKPEKLA